MLRSTPARNHHPLMGCTGCFTQQVRLSQVQAAKIIMMRPHRWPDISFGDWLARASERMHRNKAAAALANKLARMAWNILRRKTAFDAWRDEVAVGV
ncbi:hypothetical protein [Octadecabacter ascidiaceicola]|uniref:hypothetical protein n=1 Tax=Octadecabacter ascidiaceicola TaxID=1655543 RepID=UPI000B8B4877|nr:hypothetical protein [Octadecabacter ascidiaceicola]